MNKINECLDDATAFESTSSSMRLSHPEDPPYARDGALPRGRWRRLTEQASKVAKALRSLLGLARPIHLRAIPRRKILEGFISTFVEACRCGIPRILHVSYTDTRELGQNLGACPLAYPPGADSGTLSGGGCQQRDGRGANP